MNRYHAQAVVDALEQHLHAELKAYAPSELIGHAESLIVTARYNALLRKLAELQRTHAFPEPERTVFNTRDLLYHALAISVQTAIGSPHSSPGQTISGWINLNRERQTSQSYQGWRLKMDNHLGEVQHWDIPDQDVYVNVFGGFPVTTVSGQTVTVTITWPTPSVHQHMGLKLQEEALAAFNDLSPEQ